MMVWFPSRANNFYVPPTTGDPNKRTFGANFEHFPIRMNSIQNESSTFTGVYCGVLPQCEDLFSIVPNSLNLRSTGTYVSTIFTEMIRVLWDGKRLVPVGTWSSVKSSQSTRPVLQRKQVGVQLGSWGFPISYRRSTLIRLLAVFGKCDMAHP